MEFIYKLGLPTVYFHIKYGNQNKSPQPIYVKKIQVLSPIDGATNRCFLTNYEGQKKGDKK